MAGRVLVLGASGLFGTRAAEAFAAAGWQVNKFQRGTDMAAAAMGMDVIVNGLNPPNYHAWATLISQITSQVIAAGKASGATVIVPGNVYVFGNQAGPWGPATPHRPISRKGAVRANMEAAYRASGLQVIILRGGDFIDPTSAKTAMGMVMLKNLAKGKIAALGDPAVIRAYAYLPDMARAAAVLAERRGDLPQFVDMPFAGVSQSMVDLQAGLQRHGTKPLKLGQFPWVIMRVAAPFWELARELLEMRYLYDTPHTLDPRPLAGVLPEFRATPLDTILKGQMSRFGAAS